MVHTNREHINKTYMKTDTTLLKRNLSIVQIIGRYTKLKKNGGEHIGLCPFHEEKTPSFRVNDKKGVYKCFGCSAQGDVIKFVQEYEGVSFSQAVSKLTDNSLPKIKLLPEPESNQQKPVWKNIIPVPDKTSVLPTKYKNVKISTYYPYYNQDFELMGYTFRVIFSDGSKNVIPLTYNVYEDRKEWRFKGFEGKQPLYGLEQLRIKPKAKILLVEGEKCKNAGHEIFKENESVIVMSWLGGTDRVKKIDWNPLKDRTIIYWPDADTKRYSRGARKDEMMPVIEQPGTAAMTKINNMIKGKAKIIRHEKDKVNGWDIADAISSGWTANKIKKYIRQNIASFDDLYEKPPGEKRRNVRKPFQCLGYNSSHGNIFYYYLPNGTNKIVELSPVAHSKMNLLSLAPLQYWEREYINRTGVNYTQIADDCMRDCEEKGIYDPFRIRGRGAWYDQGRIVLHMGNKLIVDSREIDINGIDSYYIYESGLPIENDNFDNPLPVEDAIKLLEICKLLSWKSEVSARLLAGWLILAPICGAIDWRPHAWIAGESGTGKSWIQDHIITPVLGRFSLGLSSSSTEAGTRGAIGNDAIPITQDEMDIENKEAFRIFTKMLELARQSSSNKDSKIIKGTATGGSMAFCIRSMFLFSSVNTKLMQQSDESRFSILKLIKRADYTTGNMFEKLKIMTQAVVTDIWCSRLRSRAVKLITIIRKNIEIFCPVAAEVLRSNRHGDHIGTLLAGCYSLVNDCVIVKAQAQEYVEGVDWTVEADIKQVTDQEKLLYTICEQLILTESKEYMSIGTLIRLSAFEPNIKYSDPDEFKKKASKSSALKDLRKYGVSVIKSREDDKFHAVFAEKHSKLEELLRFTPWANGHALVLSRYPGATYKRAVFAGGRRYNCIAIPYENIITDIVEEDIEGDEEF